MRFNKLLHGDTFCCALFGVRCVSTQFTPKTAPQKVRLSKALGEVDPRCLARIKDYKRGSIKGSGSDFRMTIGVAIGTVISAVMLLASIYLILFFSSNSPALDKLTKLNVRKNQIACIEYRNSKKITYQVELINHQNSAYTNTLSKDECSGVADAIRSSETLTLLVGQNPPRLFGNRWDIYQIETDGVVRLSYQYTLKGNSTQSKEFFYGGVFFLIMVSVIVANLTYKKWRGNS